MVIQVSSPPSFVVIPSPRVLGAVSSDKLESSSRARRRVTLPLESSRWEATRGVNGSFPAPHKQSRFAVGRVSAYTHAHYDLSIDRISSRAIIDDMARA